MKALTEVMKEAEDWLGCYLQGEISGDDWRASTGMEHCLVAGRRRALAEWSVDGETLLPVIDVWSGGDRYRVWLERTDGAGAVLYGWRCFDAFGISDDINFSCACRGRIIFP